MAYKEVGEERELPFLFIAIIVVQGFEIRCGLSLLLFYKVIFEWGVHCFSFFWILRVGVVVSVDKRSGNAKEKYKR